MWSDRVDQDKMAGAQAERGARTTWLLGRSRSRGDTCRRFGGLASKPSQAGLVVWASKPSMAGLVVWASKPSVAGFTGLGLKTWGEVPRPGRRSRGGTDDTWRHRGVRIEAKLPVRRRGGRRIKLSRSE